MSSAMGRRCSFTEYPFFTDVYYFLLPVSGLLTQDISSQAAGSAFLWFSYDHSVIWVCSYIAPIAPRMDICVLCITQSTSSLCYRLLFSFITCIWLWHISIFLSCCQRQYIFHKKTGCWQQLCSLSILSFLCLSFMTDVFSFPAISTHFHLLFISIIHNWYIRLFLLLILTHCLLLCTDWCRKLVFFWILSPVPAAALAPLIYMHFSFVFFALISYRWYFTFITPKFFLFSCIYIIYNWYLFFCFTAILHTFFLFISFMTDIPSSLTYFATPSSVMYWLLPEAGLLLYIITYPGSSSCSALSACTVFLSLMSDVLIHSVHDI